MPAAAEDEADKKPAARPPMETFWPAPGSAVPFAAVRPKLDDGCTEPP